MSMQKISTQVVCANGKAPSVLNIIMYVYGIDYSIIRHLCARLAATCIAIDFGSFPSMEAATQMQKE